MGEINPTNIWQIENLIKQAFSRTRERFLSYFFASIVGFCLILGSFLLCGLIIGILFLLYTLTKSIIIISILTCVSIIAALILLIWVLSWVGLSTTQVLISKEKIGAVESYKVTRRYVWGYQWYLILYFLFTLLLAPLGFLSFSIVFILWSFWNSFAVFIYLEKKETGLNNLWLSRQLINQKFWGIAGRLLLLNASIWVLYLFLSGVKSGLAGLVTFIIHFFITPLLINVRFLMYKNLPKKITKVKLAKGWIIASIVGWLLLIGTLLLATPIMFRNISNFFNSIEKGERGSIKRYKNFFLSPTPGKFPDWSDQQGVEYQ